VTITLRYNQELELNLATYRGAITLPALQGLADFLAAHPQYLKRDALSVLAPDAYFDGVELGALDNLFGRYATLFAPLSFQIIRRSAWICQSSAAQPYVDHWLGRPGMREAMSSTQRQFESYADAGDWLVLGKSGIEAIETGAGFDDVASFDDAPILPRTAAR
jgi:hypothetical protein